MTVSALVVTLSPDPAARHRAVARLNADQRLTLGRPVRDRLPLVAQTASCRAGDGLFDELGAIDGVVKVDVVAVDLSEDE